MSLKLAAAGDGQLMPVGGLGVETAKSLSCCPRGSSLFYQNSTVPRQQGLSFLPRVCPLGWNTYHMP